MKHKREQIYEPPTVEIVEVAMEQGFAISGWGTIATTPNLETPII